MEAVSLVFAIFSLLDTSLTATRLYSSNKSFSPDFASLADDLLWQHSRFKLWAKTWQIPIDGDVVGTGPPEAATLLEKAVRDRELDPKVVELTLKGMMAQLSEGEKLATRYKPDEELEKGLSAKAKDALRRFRWLVLDFDRTKQVVSTLRAHNDNLWQAPSEIASPVLSQTVEMRARLDAAENPAFKSLDTDLAFQEWRSKVYAYTSNGEASTELSRTFGGRPIARYRKGYDKFARDLDVIVEWKPYGPTPHAQSLAIERTDRIARLLSSTLPEDLRILKCVGYFQNVDLRCCGILFQLPNPPISTGAGVEVRTLKNELESPVLHLSRWLHKDIRSDNVIFFKQSDNQDINLGAPYLGGFRIRPAGTTSPAVGEPHSIERMDGQEGPQGAVPKQKYHRAYDVYSLGCVLLEIGLWQSLESAGLGQVPDEAERVARAVDPTCSEISRLSLRGGLQRLGCQMLVFGGRLARRIQRGRE
ncbi:hypothetical protein QBC44DRAFT_393086 [Cladorrhinum sp. PSN332]|nr:hypothetical protein QBC44DRAFT_393086 [Cladorrhinum sp. PSN332]